MKNLYFCFVLFSVLCLQSCGTYGPASFFQTAKYMETPFFNGEDTSSYYVSGRYSGGVKYIPNDDNNSGALSFHYSKVSDKNIWSRKWQKRQYKHYAIGGFGILGQYNLKDSVNLGYHTFGIRGEAGNHLYSKDNNTDFSFTMNLGRSYENGSFYDFRSDYEAKNNTNPNYIPYKWTTDWGFRFGIKHRFVNYKIVNMSLGVNWSINNVVIPQFYADASYQFNKKWHINLNYVFLPKAKGDNTKSLINFINLGIACGF
jgi:hypothetical protein